MDFTILGMGKTGHAAACYLMEQGHKVTVWDRNPDKIAALQENGISIYGQIVGVFRPESCQAIGEAVGESRYLLVFTTAIGHRPIAEALKGKNWKKKKSSWEKREPRFLRPLSKRRVRAI